MGKTTASGVKKVTKFNKEHKVTETVTTVAVTTGTTVYEAGKKANDSSVGKSIKSSVSSIGSGISSLFGGGGSSRSSSSNAPPPPAMTGGGVGQGANYNRGSYGGGQQF